ncbi:hypothetical protein NC652_011190 [Populus alba x Populus x berolinensis]|nr:hypothetical protein NC652_011190 [Populus alba x Populus x berolinensis]
MRSQNRDDQTNETSRCCCCCLQIFRVKSVKVEAISFLGAIGLLGEYSPSSRKKGGPLFDTISYMHFGLFDEYPEFQGCSWIQPFLTKQERSFLAKESLEDNIAAAQFLNSSICVQ